MPFAEKFTTICMLSIRLSNITFSRRSLFTPWVLPFPNLKRSLYNNSSKIRLNPLDIKFNDAMPFLNLHRCGWIRWKSNIFLNHASSFLILLFFFNVHVAWSNSQITAKQEADRLANARNKFVSEHSFPSDRDFVVTISHFHPSDFISKIITRSSRIARSKLHANISIRRRRATALRRKNSGITRGYSA